MATPFKRGVLAQVEIAAATTEEALYTCPAYATGGVDDAWVSIVNRGVAGTYRVRVRKAGAVDHDKQYEAYDDPVPAAATAGSIPRAIVDLDALEAGDVVEVYASHTNMSFAMHGRERQ